VILIKVDDLDLWVKYYTTLLDACTFAGLLIPKFCYHEKLSIAGSCRMCLVEVEEADKPLSSCTFPVHEEDTYVYTNSLTVKKSRENILELLLSNHPLDCPICDQAGECDLQDQTKVYGTYLTRVRKNKNSSLDLKHGPLLKTIMTRCIHCTRCVRFTSEIAGIGFLGVLNRGHFMEINEYSNNLSLYSEILGNLIDLCPVGAITSKPYAFKARPWELKMVDTVDLTDSFGSNVYFHFKETLVVRITPKISKSLNEN